MPDMKVAIGFRREPRGNALWVAAGFEVGSHQLADKVSWRVLIGHYLAAGRTAKTW